MLVQDIQKIEKAYFADRSIMAVPRLLCAYYEEKQFELVYYFAEKYQSVFQESDFYRMMSLAELGYQERAWSLYEKHADDWFSICRQGKIYWKHVALFCLYFKELYLSGYYRELFDDYYQEAPVQLIGLFASEKPQQAVRTAVYEKTSKEYPVLKKTWEPQKVPPVSRAANIKWKIWEQYNAAIGNGGQYGMETVYDQDGLQIYSYKPKQAAASMHIITDGNTTIVLDCGCEITENGPVRIPVNEIFAYYGITKADAVFITHAHMDHYGSLNEIRDGKIYMTAMTRQLIRIASPETRLSQAAVLEAYAYLDIDGVNTAFIPNGHIAGSVMTDTDWKGKKRIVYTGDFSVEDQKTVTGFQTDDILLRSEKRIDVLLMETTYGRKKEMLCRRHYEKMFTALCAKQAEYGNKVIIPCFAAGAVQEAALLLADMAKQNGLKILIDGKAAEITQYYQFSMGKNILSRNISVCNSAMEYAEKLLNHDIILASSGMLKPGSDSAGYVEEMIEKEKVSVIKIGFMRQGEHMLMSIINREHKNIHYMDILLAVHAGYSELVEILERLSPECAVYVHGTGI